MKKFCIISNGLKDKDYEVTHMIKNIIENNGGTTVVVQKGFESSDKELEKVQKTLQIDYFRV